MKPNRHINKIKKYTSGKPTGEVKREFGLNHVIKLASNENPWGCPVSADQLADTINTAMIYPNLNRPALITRLSTDHQLPEDHFILGNGSDELLQLLALTFLSADTESITAQHTFSVYRHVSQLVGATCVEVLMSELSYSVDAILSAVTEQTRVVFIANPNNPTGRILTCDQLNRLLAHLSSDIIVVLDEAYREFVTLEDINATLSLLADYSNLVILRTFSKAYGLAGFRVGYAMGSPELIEILHKVRPPFNVNSLALVAAELALDCSDFLSKTITNNSQQREWLYAEINQMGLTVIDSQANFLCILVNRPAMDVYQGLLRKGYIIRPLDSFGLADYIRVTIGTPEQNQGFLSAFKQVLTELGQVS